MCDKLKLKLFVRHARRLSPTPEADILFKHAAEVNQQISKFNIDGYKLKDYNSAIENILDIRDKLFALF